MGVYLLIFISLGANIFSCLGQDMTRTNMFGEFTFKTRPSRNLLEPTGVNVSLFIHSIEIDEVRQVVGISCEFLQCWDDFRIRYLEGTMDDVVLHGDNNEEIVEQFWLPDVTVANALPRTKNHGDDYIRIRRIAEVTWTQRLYIEFPCDMNFESYPLDSHQCRLKLQSASYYEDELKADWSSGYEIEFDIENLHITPRYELMRVETMWDTVPSRPKVKRQLVAEFHFESVSGWTTKHTVLPFVAAVTTAYLAFFVNVKGICTRILMVGIAMIMASIFHESTYRGAPRPAYTMGLEIFTGISLAFIWFAAVETVLVDVISNLGRSPFKSDNEDREELQDGPSRAIMVSMWVDRIFRVVYPVAYIIFNAIYWIVYSARSYQRDHYKHNHVHTYNHH